MNNKLFTISVFVACCLIFGCSKEKPATKIPQQAQTTSSVTASKGAKQISGIGYLDQTNGCDAAALGADYALNMTGDLQGCLYTYIDGYECSPSGTYREVGREYFSGLYKGQYGTFWTNYKFEAKYEACAENGSYLGAEIKGRCQHPIATGSGEGVFKGVSGRLAFVDSVAAANYPYTGHLLF